MIGKGLRLVNIKREVDIIFVSAKFLIKQP